MTDDIIDYDPQDYPEAVAWAKERAKELRRQAERIAEMEAENEKAVAFGQACVAGGADWMKRAEQAEAELEAAVEHAQDLTSLYDEQHDELAALKARRCVDCSQRRCPIEGDMLPGMFSCSWWEARP